MVGQITMPINILIQAKDNSNICYNGKVRVNLKQNNQIGTLKIRVDYKSLQPNDEFSFGKNAKLRDKLSEYDADVIRFFNI